MSEMMPGGRHRVSTERLGRDQAATVCADVGHRTQYARARQLALTVCTRKHHVQARTHCSRSLHDHELRVVVERHAQAPVRKFTVRVNHRYRHGQPKL